MRRVKITVALEEDFMGLAEERLVDYTESSAIVAQHHGHEAIQCCIDSWNKLCSRHQLVNVTEAVQRRKWLVCGPRVTILKQGEELGEISKIAFSINRKLTAKVLQENKGLSLIVVSCLTWWNREDNEVRGWPDQIVVDTERNCVTQFPEIAPAKSCLYCYPLHE